MKRKLWHVCTASALVVASHSHGIGLTADLLTLLENGYRVMLVVLRE